MKEKKRKENKERRLNAQSVGVISRLRRNLEDRVHGGFTAPANRDICTFKTGNPRVLRRPDYHEGEVENRGRFFLAPVSSTVPDCAHFAILEERQWHREWRRKATPPRGESGREAVGSTARKMRRSG